MYILTTDCFYYAAYSVSEIVPKSGYLFS